MSRAGLVLAVGIAAACRADGATAPAVGAEVDAAAEPGARPEPGVVEPAASSSGPAVEATPAAAAPVDAAPVDATPQGDSTTGEATPVVAGDSSGGEPAPPLRPSKKWPFHQWDGAKAVVYNLNDPRGGGSLYAYNESKGWNAKIHREVEVDRKLADKAVSLVGKTKGEMMVSKCAYPRHAIVLLSGKTPVASINVCFECGDILVWPAYDPSPSWPDRKRSMTPKLLEAYDRVFPQWTRLFEKDLGLQTDWKKIE